MQFKKSLLTAALLAVGGLTAVSTAFAATTVSGSFQVKLTILPVCTVTAASAAQDINLGSVNANAAVPVGNSASDISVACSKTTPFTINLIPGSTNTDGTGVVTDPVSTNTIAYKLTTDAAGTIPWGNTGAITGTGTGVTTPVLEKVYATVTGSTDVTPGAYADTVAVNVIY